MRFTERLTPPVVAPPRPATGTSGRNRYLPASAVPENWTRTALTCCEGLRKNWQNPANPGNKRQLAVVPHNTPPNIRHAGPPGNYPNAPTRRSLTARSHYGTIERTSIARCQPQGDSDFLRGTSACPERHGSLVSSRQTRDLVQFRGGEAVVQHGGFCGSARRLRHRWQQVPAHRRDELHAAGAVHPRHHDA